ncbi:MAG: hypothetical protein JWO36_4895 [Myxococcales bacterium]|nr:hypothetical protein [Myxococcales bacterium]
MRNAGFLVVLLLGAVLTLGCKNSNDATAAAPDPAAVKKQQELIARRDTLLAARSKLQSDRDKIDLEIKDAQSKGVDTSELVKKRADLDTQIETQSSEVISTMQSGFASLQAANDKSAQVAAREAEVANRERGYASREEKMAERERQLAQREATLAQREKETCGVSAAPVIIQAPVPKGGNYSHKDITDLITRAKSSMAKRGILGADLPGPAQGLEAEAQKALGENNVSSAYVYAAQLAQNVEAIKIDRQFIAQKHARLSAQVKSSKLDDGTQQQLSGILSDVMQKFGDGDFTAANKRLNQLAALLH